MTAIGRRGLRRRLPVVAIGYVTVLAAGSIVLALSSPATRQALLSASSTDTAHLGRDPWLVLPSSAVWVTGSLGYWLPVAGLSIAAVESVIGAPLAAALVVGVHSAASLLSEGLLGYRVATGALPAHALEVLDVGPSYIVLAAVGAAAALLRSWWRAIGLLVLVAPVLTTTAHGLATLEVDAVGHVLSLGLGAGTALAVVRLSREKTPAPGIGRVRLGTREHARGNEPVEDVALT